MFTLKVEDADKLYLSSDSHWGHFNISKYCHRPFESRKEMDDTLIANWNAVVPDDGIVVHCGDFMLPHKTGGKEYKKIWDKLNFKTLYLGIRLSFSSSLALWIEFISIKSPNHVKSIEISLINFIKQ